MGQLVDIDIRIDKGETRSGIQALNPKIFARYEEASRKLAFVLIHPTNNFMNHYLVEPLRKRGAAVLAANTRYAGNETFLILERAMLDLGAAIRFLRAEGYGHICLIGNSGGAALSALYQAEAENRSIARLADGRAIDLADADLPPVDRLALVAAHPGRARALTTRLDASVIDERDLHATDPELDIFSPAVAKPFAPAFVERVRAAQIARNRRITAWCQAKLRAFRSPGFPAPIVDQIFTVHRTMADPRFVDATLDPSPRAAGTALESDAAVANFGVSATAAATTLTSWLSQWSIDHSVGDGPRCLSRTTVPTLLINFLADEIVYPSDAEAWRLAAPAGADRWDLPGVGHYPQRTPGAADRIADTLIDWAKD